MSSSYRSPPDQERLHNIRRQCPQFRILIIGRANAGKTTILQRVCKTTEYPEVFTPQGKKIEISVLESSVNRGQHDIKNDMVFRNNPRFIFHDSCGFEAGDISELGIVKDFIKERSKKKKLREQLHAIWYCIPVGDSRPIGAAEEFFFSKCGTGHVPVIVLFTKTDFFDDEVIEHLLEHHICQTIEEARVKASQEDWLGLKKQLADQIGRMKHQPKGYVFLRNMQLPGADCKDLILRSSAALSNEILEQLFVSVQQNNLEICIEYAIRKAIIKSTTFLAGGKYQVLAAIGQEKKTLEMLVKNVAHWFPHVRRFFEFSEEDEEELELRRRLKFFLGGGVF